MKKSVLTLPATLTALLTLSMLAIVFVRAFWPQLILPRLDIPTMVLLCLLALLAEHWFSPQANHHYLLLAVLGAMNFGLLPFAACFVGAGEALKLAVLGAVVFTCVTWLFSSMMDRLSSGPAAKLAPFMSALGLYLAAQCFMGF